MNLDRLTNRILELANRFDPYDYADNSMGSVDDYESTQSAILSGDPGLIEFLQTIAAESNFVDERKEAMALIGQLMKYQHGSDVVSATTSHNHVADSDRITFNSAQEIYDALYTKDLFCVNLETYMFLYNDEDGAIAYYDDITLSELHELAEDADISGEQYVSGVLGPFGNIIDPTPSGDVAPILAFLDRYVGCDFIYADVADLIKE